VDILDIQGQVFLGIRGRVDTVVQAYRDTVGIVVIRVIVAILESLVIAVTVVFLVIAVSLAIVVILAYLAIVGLALVVIVVIQDTLENRAIQAYLATQDNQGTAVSQVIQDTQA
jgi:hypothetical protein